MKTTLAYKVKDNSNGTESWDVMYLPTCRIARKFAKAINDKTGKTVYIGKGHVEHMRGADFFKELNPFGMQNGGEYAPILSNYI